MMKTDHENQKLYIDSPAGDSILVEIFEEGGVVSLLMGTKRYDFSRDAAFDLADALLMIASNIDFHIEKW